MKVSYKWPDTRVMIPASYLPKLPTFLMNYFSAHLGKSVISAFVSPIALILVSILVIVISVGLANSTFAFEAKTKIFLAIVVTFTLYCMFSFFSRIETPTWNYRRKGSSDDEIDRKLSMFEDASNYFSGSIKPPDMMRLVAAKIREIVPFDDCVLLKVDSVDGKLRAMLADGQMAPMLRSSEFGINVGLAGKANISKMIQVTHGFVVTDGTYLTEAIDGFRSSAAIPLSVDGNVNAILQLFSRDVSSFSSHHVNLLEAIGTRIAPLVIGSLSYERSVDSALTDPITAIPNERALFLVLDNQLAETQRRPDERPISVISVDIKGFADINDRFGHSTGDRLLAFVADKIKGQLRNMDFFARANNDEFLILLPTAAEHKAIEVIDRLRTEFFGCRFRANESQTVQIELNFGHASFGDDGESAKDLVAAGRTRREQSKMTVKNTVVWFPREYVN